MNSHCIRKLKFLDIFKTIHSLFIIIANIYYIICSVDICQNTYVAVKNTCTVIVTFIPRHIVVVFDLHYSVAFAQNVALIFDFVFLPRRRIKPCLKNSVNILCARFAHSARAKHLNVVHRVKAERRRYPCGDKIEYLFRHIVFDIFLKQKEVRLGAVVKNRHFTGNNSVSVCDDFAFHCLTEHLIKHNNINHSAFNHIAQNIACADRWQLILVANHNKAAMQRQCVKK